jgi:hypothetical protein
MRTSHCIISLFTILIFASPLAADPDDSLVSLIDTSQVSEEQSWLRLQIAERSVILTSGVHWNTP